MTSWDDKTWSHFSQHNILKVKSKYIVSITIMLTQKKNFQVEFVLTFTTINLLRGDFELHVYAYVEERILEDPPPAREAGLRLLPRNLTKAAFGDTHAAASAVLLARLRPGFHSCSMFNRYLSRKPLRKKQVSERVLPSFKVNKLSPFKFHNLVRFFK